MCEVPLCLLCHDASADIQKDQPMLSGEAICSNLWSNFQMDFLRSKWICFDASRGEEDDGVKVFLCLSFFKSYMFAKR